MRKYLDESSTINEIRLLLRHPSTKQALWVLVEGETDQKLYAKLIDGHKTKVEWVHGGVESLRKALSTLSQETAQVLGIRDADFLHLNRQQETIERLFLTDAHDTEMMMLVCDTVFAAVVAEYLPERRNEFASLRDKLLASVSFLAGLRWLNDSGCLELNFQAGLTHFYDATNLAVNDEACIGAIAQCSPRRKHLPQAHEVRAKIADVTDYYNLCQGHDVESALALHITEIAKKTKGNGVRGAEIGKALRLAYRLEDFAKTSLYRSLKDWESQTGYQLFANA